MSGAGRESPCRVVSYHTRQEHARSAQGTFQAGLVFIVPSLLTSLPTYLPTYLASRCLNKTLPVPAAVIHLSLRHTSH
ncbi:hypothetical protein CGRA01v4_12275 [Colletotrichum graminicola]|nr:hypothetical protein CGRA01v4_12275 [Colletotrichum graminicola]